MLASTPNANPKLTEYIPKEIEEKMGSLIADSLPYYKSIFKEMILANQHNAMLLYEFLVTEQNEQNIKLRAYPKIIFL